MLLKELEPHLNKFVTYVDFKDNRNKKEVKKKAVLTYLDKSTVSLKYDICGLFNGTAVKVGLCSQVVKIHDE